MIDLNIGKLYTTIHISSETKPSEIIALINRECMARPEGYMYMPKYKNHTWDGYINLFKRGMFPSGLARNAMDALDNAGYDFDAYLNYKVPKAGKVTYDMLNGITLRDYQIEAATALLRSTRGVAKMATGSGKTEVMAAILKAVNEKAIVLTTKLDILYQTKKRLSFRLGESIGIVGDGRWDVERVTVATVQTLQRAMDGDDGLCAEVVIFDECHHVPSKTAQDVMFSIPAAYRYGFSGTALDNGKLNDLVLVAATGNLVYELSASDLIRKGYAARPSIQMRIIESCGEYEDYHDEYVNEVVKSDKRNGVIVTLLKDCKYNAALILVERLEHGRILHDMIPGSMYANGSMSAEERDDVLDVLRRGDGAVVIATPIFDEGVDIPSADLIVLAGAGKSSVRLMQRLGRGMRVAHGKTTFTVIDFVDSSSYLQKHSYYRAKLYEAEGFNVEVL